jgi:putative ABC transport system ATP-binding protein
MSLPMLRLENVSLLKGKTWVLKEVSATIDPGDVVIITGPSGAGKTSLLRLLCRLEDPTSGSIALQNEPIQNLVPHEYRKTVGLVFQTPIFFEGSVLHNLQQTDRLNHRSVRSVAFYGDALEQVGLTVEKLEQDALSLSLGEKQRLAVARTLLNEPRILLLDEPISALDSDSATLLLQALDSLNKKRGLTILMVTHQTPSSILSGTRRWRFEQGRMLADPPR